MSHKSTSSAAAVPYQQHADACAEYVATLRTRHQEEDSSRRSRARRRADFLNLTSQQCRRRDADLQRSVMEAKLGMMSQVERDLLGMLDEQFKWRHIMLDNIVSREDQLRQLRQSHETATNELFAHLAQASKESYEISVRDDTKRHQTASAAQSQAARREVTALCSHIVDDVWKLTSDVIHYAESKTIDVMFPTGTRMVDMIPPAVFRSLKASHFPAAETPGDIAQKHISTELYKPAADHQDAAAQQLHNTIFCSLVAKATHIKHPPRGTFQPKTVIPKALIVVIGPAYSGKTTVCRAIAERHNLLLVSDVSLVTLALEALERPVAPEDLDDDQAVELLDLGRAVRQQLSNGQPVSDEIMARLLLRAWLTLPESVDGLLVDGVAPSLTLIQRVEAVLSGFRPPDPPAPAFALAPVQLGNLEEKVLLVEKAEEKPAADAVTGPATATGPTAKEAKKPEPKAAAAAGGKKDAKGGKNVKEEVEVEPLPPIDLPVVDPVPPLTQEEQQVLEAANPKRDVSGIAKIVCLSLPAATSSFARFAGIRVEANPTTGTPRDQQQVPYHVEWNPPPLDRIESTVPLDRVDAGCASLHLTSMSFAAEYASLRAWADAQFPGILDTMPADAESAEEFVETSVVKALAAAQYASDVVKQAASITQARHDMEELFAKRSAAREAIRKQLLQIYTERAVDPLPAELVAITPGAIDVSKDKGGAGGGDAKEILPVPPQVADVIFAVLERFTGHFEKTVAGSMDALVKLLSTAFDQGSVVASQCAAFWRQPDHKQGLVDKYVHELNAMTPALRRDVQGKEELHLRADALLEALHAVTDRRREESQALIDQLLSPATFADGWNDAVRLVGSGLVQLEVERFMIVRHLAFVYFASVKGETFHTEEADFNVDTLTVPRFVDPSANPTAVDPAGGSPIAGAGAAAAGAKPGAKVDPKAKPAPPPKKGAPQPPTKTEEEQRALEDPLVAAVDKANGIMKGAVDKATAPPAPVVAAAPAKGGGKKPTAAEIQQAQLEEANRKPVVTVASLAAQILVPEFDLAKKRIAVIVDFVRRLIDEFAQRLSVLRGKVTQRHKDRLYREYEANASVVHFLRCRVEEEVPVEHALVMEDDSFRVDYGHRLLPTINARSGATGGANAPLASSPGGATAALSTSMGRAPALVSSSSASGAGGGGGGAMDALYVISSLTMGRAMHMIALFKRVAPHYIVQLSDFRRIVSVKDWQFQHSQHAPKSVDAMFQAFDINRADAIDWREFIVHLLLWAEPPMAAHADPAASQGPFGGGVGGSGRNPYFVDGPSLIQLYDVRDVLGSELLDHDSFVQSDLYFESQMDDERANAYKELLWECFSQISEIEPGVRAKLIDPNVLALFLCADEQPLRGVQKAFAMAAEVGDESYALTIDRLYGLFHFNAASRAALGLVDPYARDDLEVLYTPGGPEAIAFQDACSSIAGRVLLNSCRLFARRKF